MTDLYTKSPEIANDFAAQAARNAFGKYSVRPRDRDFHDHEPRWQRLGDVADGVVDGLRHRRDFHLAGLHNDVGHDMVKV